MTMNEMPINKMTEWLISIQHWPQVSAGLVRLQEHDWEDQEGRGGTRQHDITHLSASGDHVMKPLATVIYCHSIVILLLKDLKIHGSSFLQPFLN
jgi:hypothetical protein